MTDESIDFLLRLESVIDERRAASSDQSYTASLFAAGSMRMAQKVGEEAVELALASIQPDRARVLCEAADLVYHLLVLLRARDISLADVAEELASRHREPPRPQPPA